MIRQYTALAMLALAATGCRMCDSCYPGGPVLETEGTRSGSILDQHAMHAMPPEHYGSPEHVSHQPGPPPQYGYHGPPQHYEGPQYGPPRSAGPRHFSVGQLPPGYSPPGFGPGY